MCNTHKRRANEMTKIWLKPPKNLAWSLQPTNFLYRMSFALRWSQHHRSIANKGSEQFWAVHVRISSCKVHQGWVEAWKWGYYIDHATHWTIILILIMKLNWFHNEPPTQYMNNQRTLSISHYQQSPQKSSMTVTHYAEWILANTRPHQLCWNNQEIETAISCTECSQVADFIQRSAEALFT